MSELELTPDGLYERLLASGVPRHALMVTGGGGESLLVTASHRHKTDVRDSLDAMGFDVEWRGNEYSKTMIVTPEDDDGQDGERPESR